MKAQLYVKAVAYRREVYGEGGRNFNKHQEVRTTRQLEASLFYMLYLMTKKLLPDLMPKKLSKNKLSGLSKSLRKKKM